MISDLMSRVFYGQVITRAILEKQLNLLYQTNYAPTLQNLLQFIQSAARKQHTMGMGDVYQKLIARLELLVSSECFNCVEGIPLSYFQNHNLVVELDGLEPTVQAFIVAFVIKSLQMHNISIGATSIKHLIIIEEAENF